MANNIVPMSPDHKMFVGTADKPMEGINTRNIMVARYDIDPETNQPVQQLVTPAEVYDAVHGAMDIQSDLDRIEGKADSAQSSANDAATAASQAGDKADIAQTAAQSATSAAQAAKTAADTADAKAVSAQNSADAASGLASTAKSTADSALTTANTAISNAAQAQGIATNALTTATTAQSTANSAVASIQTTNDRVTDNAQAIGAIVTRIDGVQTDVGIIQTNMGDIQTTVSELEHEVDGARVATLTGTYLSRIVGGNTNVPMSAFPAGSVFVPGKTIVFDMNGTTGVYTGNLDANTLRILTKTTSFLGADEPTLLGNVPTHASLPTTAGAAQLLWGRAVAIDDYARVQNDETMGGATVEWYIVSMLANGNITWGNPVVLNTSDYQAQTTAAMAGRIPFAGSTPGTWAGSFVPQAMPVMDGVATSSVSGDFTLARGDHRHPSDTAKANATISITPTAPLTGGGNLTANRTIGINGASAATATAAGGAGSVTYAAGNDRTSWNRAVTPAGVTAQIAAATVRAGASTSTAAGTVGTTQLAADNDTTSRDKAVTPAGLAAAIAASAGGLKEVYSGNILTIPAASLTGIDTSKPCLLTVNALVVSPNTALSCSVTLSNTPSNPYTIALGQGGSGYMPSGTVSFAYTANTSIGITFSALSLSGGALSWSTVQGTAVRVRILQ